MPEAPGNLKGFDHFRTLIREVQEALRQRGATVATAESCTGGILAFLLTRAAGSSDVYVGGVSAYANAVKENLLGVAADLIARRGAVSAEVAGAMAEGARTRVGATFGVAVTGIAGPDGGTAAKPVGTVFVAASGPGGTQSAQLALIGDRDSIREQASEKALELLKTVILRGKGEG